MSVEPNGKNESGGVRNGGLRGHTRDWERLRAARQAPRHLSSRVEAMERNVWQLEIWERHRFCW